MTEEYFTPEERAKLLSAIKELSDLGITILDRDTKHPLPKQGELTDRSAFFAKAKLWRVVKEIVREVFLQQLIDKKIFFSDGNGTSYTVKEE